MYVCVCNPFNDATVKDRLETARGQNITPGRLYQACSGGKKPQCCQCIDTLKAMIAGRQNAPAAG